MSASSTPQERAAALLVGIDKHQSDVEELGRSARRGSGKLHGVMFPMTETGIDFTSDTCKQSLALLEGLPSDSQIGESSSIGLVKRDLLTLQRQYYLTELSKVQYCYEDDVSMLDVVSSTYYQLLLDPTNAFYRDAAHSIQVAGQTNDEDAKRRTIDLLHIADSRDSGYTDDTVRLAALVRVADVHFPSKKVGSRVVLDLTNASMIPALRTMQSWVADMQSSTTGAIHSRLTDCEQEFLVRYQISQLESVRRQCGDGSVKQRLKEIAKSLKVDKSDPSARKAAQTILERCAFFQSTDRNGSNQEVTLLVESLLETLDHQPTSLPS